MPDGIAYLPDEATIVLENLGSMTVDNAKALTGQIASLLEQHKTNRLLVDASNMVIQMTLTDIFWLVDSYYGEVKFPTTTNIAIVLPHHALSAEQVRFYQNAAVKRGYHVSLFHTRPDALHWLQSCKN